MNVIVIQGEDLFVVMKILPMTKDSISLEKLSQPETKGKIFVREFETEKKKKPTLKVLKIAKVGIKII